MKSENKNRVPIPFSRRLVSRHEVAEFAGVCVRSIMRWVDAGQFPKPVIMPGGLKRWAGWEVADWLASRSKKQEGES